MKVKNKIKIQLNGKIIQINNNETLKKLVKRLNLPLNKVAIELNKKIIDKKKLNIIKLNNNDIIEVVHFIGGG
ncbi:MAG: thiamine biosynthesis protein ThiS [Pelagibacteraceae bacterium]|nr:thiamine biosynthesis protein ThiS [Pelagibacteraceae bacterium]|tara:strand:+ start:271 stop:489 length:219 start_codon:yes stop_codon:yes gene_type:complete